MSQIFSVRRQTYNRNAHYVVAENTSTENAVSSICYSTNNDPATYGLPKVQYSLNRGSSWITFDGYTSSHGYYVSAAVTINPGESVWLRGITINLSSYYNHFRFTGGAIKLSGITSALLDYRKNKNQSFNYSYLFASSSSEYTSSLTSVSDLFIPDHTSSKFTAMFMGCTNLTDTLPLPKHTTPSTSWCSSMYSNCSSLVSVPSDYLSSFTLANSCYAGMFNGCTSLVDPPSLPAESLTVTCYSQMFSGCTSLLTPPSLPASTLVRGCYFRMYYGCTNLNTSADYLVFTSISSYSLSTNTYGCCEGMFENCQSLNATHTLRPTTLYPNAYAWMYSGCWSLSVPPSLPAVTLSPYCYQGMFRDCTSIVSTASLGGFSKTYDFCFAHMYNGCVNLSTVSDTHFAKASCLGSYAYMFANCHSLRASAMPTVPKASMTSASSRGQLDWHFSSSRNTTTFLINPSIPDSYYFDDENLTYLSSYDYKYPSSSHFAMFIGCRNLDGINFLSPNTSAFIKMYTFTFAYCPSITSIPSGSALCDIAPSSVECSYMFAFTFWNILPAKFPSSVKSTYNPLLSSIPADMFKDFTSRSSDTGLYADMFGGCKNLTVTPILPSTKIGPRCYQGMFQGCSSLTSACTLNHVTSLGDFVSYPDYGCCEHMYFNSGITSISNTNIPAATTAQKCCYAGMFACTPISSLSGLQLPATSLAVSCYEFMFGHCKNLASTSSNLLSATTSLTAGCYANMFAFCSSLSSFPDLPATTLADSCYQGMFAKCSSLYTASVFNIYISVDITSGPTFSSIPDLSHVVSFGANSCYFMFGGCESLTNLSSQSIGTDAASAGANALSFMFSGCTELLYGPTINIALSNTQDGIYGGIDIDYGISSSQSINVYGCNKLLYAKFTQSPTASTTITRLFSKVYNFKHPTVTPNAYIESAGILDIPTSTVWDTWCAITTTPNGLPPTWIARPSTTYTWAGMPLGSTLWCSDLYDSNSGGSFALSGTKFSIGPTTNLSNLTGWVGTEASPMANTLYAGMSLEFTRPLPNGKLSINPFSPGSSAGTTYNITTPLTFNVDNTSHTITAACDANCSALEIIWSDGSYSSIPAYPTDASGYESWINSNTGSMSFALNLGTPAGKRIGCYTGCTKNSTYYTLYHTFASPNNVYVNFDWDGSTFFNYLYNLHDANTYFFSAHSIIVFAHYATVKKPYFPSENPILDCIGDSMPIASYSLTYSGSTDRYKLIVTQN